MKVVLDTNALMVPEQFKVEILSELQRLGYTECMVPSAVMEELRNLTNYARGKDKIAARIGIALAERCKIIETGKESKDALNADQSIENLAIQERVAVFTNDKALKKRLFSKGITVIYLRQGRYLEATKREL
jgi:rRNA-processing protein FCF1